MGGRERSCKNHALRVIEHDEILEEFGEKSRVVLKKLEHPAVARSGALGKLSPGEPGLVEKGGRALRKVLAGKESLGAAVQAAAAGRGKISGA